MKRTILLSLLLTLVIFGRPEPLRAQLLPIRTFNVQDGLPQSQVTALLQDSLGYLWVGTADGLARFDGRFFENFTSHNGLTGNNVTAAFKDGDSLLWFGLGRFGISIYENATRGFRPFTFNDSLLTHKITAILRDPYGVVWIGTEQYGLFRYDGDSLRHLGRAEGLPSTHVSFLAMGPDSTLWVATWQGILMFDPRDFDRPQSFHYITSADGLPDVEIENILFYHKRYIWMGTHKKGLIRARWQKTAPAHLYDFRVFDKSGPLPANWVRCLSKDHSGNIWVGTSKGAVQITRPLSKTPEFFTISMKNGLGHSTIDVIFEDREHLVWIGTWGGGLSRYGGKYFETFTTSNGLPDNNVWGFYEDSLHTLWMGTEKGLVGFREHPKHQTLVPRYVITSQNGLPFDFILSLEGDGHNGLWLGGWGKGLAYVQPYKKIFKHFSTKDGLPSDFVVSIKQDRHGNFWIATLDHGISYFNPVTQTFKNYNTGNGFPSDRINYIYKDRRGNFWFLTKDKGVVRYDGKKFQQFSGVKQKLACGVTCMLEDNQGNFWFGTPSNGVLVIKKGKGLIRHLTEASGLGGDNIFILALDAKGRVWIGTKRGMDCYDPKDSSLIRYGFSDGFLCLEPNQNANLTDSRGHCWFGGIAGATRYLPEYDHYEPMPPKIILTNIKLALEDKEIPANHKLAYGQNHLTFYFSGLSFRNPEGVKYSYKLVGFNPDWSLPTSNNSVTYSNLAPGHYTFMVKAISENGRLVSKPAVYSFTIVPPFWMHWYFAFFVVALVLLTIYMVFHWRVRRIQKQKILLEQMVKSRTEKLEKITKNLRNAYSSLKESENKFRLLTDTISSAVFIYQHNKFVYVNHATSVLTGYSREELLKMDFREFVHPDFREMVYERALARQGGKKVPEHYEFKIIRKDGTERWLDLTATRMEFEGKPAGLGTAFDITDRKKAEEAVKESELHLRTLINAMPDIVCFKDGQGRWMEANEFDLKLFEIDNVPYKGKKDSELAQYSTFYKEAFLACEASDEEAWQRGTISRGEEIVPRRDGTFKVFDVIKVPVFNEDGSRRGLVVIGRDITERKKAEQELRKEKERLSAILSSIHEGLIATDEHYRILFYNQYAKEIIGEEDGELLNKKVEELAIMESSSCKKLDTDNLKKQLENGQVVHPEMLLDFETQSGRRLLLDATCSPIINPAAPKEINGVVITFRDVSQQKKLEEELFKARKLESLAILAGGLAHDFNNILTAIIGNLSLIKLRLSKNPDCPQKLLQLLERAETASLRAQGLTQQLLTFSKGGAPVKKAANLQELIKDSIAFILRGSKIHYEVRLPDDLWPVEIDEGQIAQVINNLTINALQAMPEGGHFEVVGENVYLQPDESIPLPSGKYVKITFEDTGMGIPAEILPRIFDPYFTTKKHGNGLGLASTYSIIKKHGGYITVASQVGKGAVFTFYLPASDKQVKQIKSREAKVAIQLKGKRVLVMDDEEHIRELVKEILESHGMNVLEAQNGQEAIDVFADETQAGRKIDLVILDLTVPGGLGGEKAIKAIREINPHIRAIVSSGYSNDPIMARFREYGFDGVVAKPYKASKLIATVKRVLSEPKSSSESSR